VAGFLIGAEKDGLAESEELEEGLQRGLVVGMGVEEVSGGWVCGVVDDLDECVEVMGKDFTIMWAEVMIAVVVEGWRGGGESSRLSSHWSVAVHVEGSR
jgi:hypothetical protein